MTLNINDLSTAYALCSCGSVCTRSCTVCHSVSWEKGPCVKQLWFDCGYGCFEGAHSPECERHSSSIRYSTPMRLTADILSSIPMKPQRTYTNPQLPLHDDVVERCIDWLESQGMPLHPWQAKALRAIMAREP